MHKDLPSGKAPVDIVDAIGYGYKLAWAERRYLLRLALLPVILKLVCQILVLAFGVNHAYMQQALISLPAYFVEGWMLSHVARLVMFGQRWPFRPTGDMAQDVIVLGMRARGILAGTVLYVLIRYILTGFFGLLQYVRDRLQDAEGQSGTIADITTVNEAANMQAAPGAFFAALILMVVMIWAFRFMWLYIPAALGADIGDFMRKSWRFFTSIQMMGIWLMGSVPLFFMLSVVASALLGKAALAQDGGLPVFIFTFMWVMTDVATMIVTTASMTHAYRAYFTPR